MNKKDKKKKRENAEDPIITRRNFLKRMGKYSGIAAAALAGSSFLTSGCDFLDKLTGKSGDDNAVSPSSDTTVIKDGKSFDNAISIEFDKLRSVSLNKDKTSVYYKVNNTKSIDLVVVDFNYMASGGSGTCTVFDSNKKQVGLKHNVSVHKITFSINGLFYLYFASGGILELVFQPSIGNISTWSNSYSDTASDTTGTYSDTTTWNNKYSDYSDWNNRWAHAYNDWSNAWGNWMESW